MTDTASLRKVNLSDFNSQECLWCAQLLGWSGPWTPHNLDQHHSHQMAVPSHQNSGLVHPAPLPGGWIMCRAHYCTARMYRQAWLTPRVGCRLEKGASGKPNGSVIIPTHPSVQHSLHPPIRRTVCPHLVPLSAKQPFFQHCPEFGSFWMGPNENGNLFLAMFMEKNG